MKPPAIVAPAVTEAEFIHRWDLACGKEERADKTAEVALKTAQEAREEKGRILVDVRKTLFKGRGDGFAEWVQRRFRTDIRTAQRYMGFVTAIDDKVSSNEPPPKTYADAGIVRRPAKVEPEEPREIEATPARAEVSDAQREAAYRREVDGSLPPHMEERERSTHDLVGFVADARSKLRQITERNVHLTDVTTSPEDFMRAKQMLIDIVNLCLDELASAGVLDGKEQRRQMQLLKGGIQ